MKKLLQEKCETDLNDSLIIDIEEDKQEKTISEDSDEEDKQEKTISEDSDEEWNMAAKALESINIEEEKKEECVICFEIVNEDIGDFKFNCNHKKYMHNECIKNLTKCPMCRTRCSEEEYAIVVGTRRMIIKPDFFVFFVFTGFCCILSWAIIYPMYLLGLAGGGRYNNNTAIANMTNITNITSDIVF